MDELTREFLIESQEGLDRMERCLTDLEERPDDAALIADIFRSVHTIKGTTGFLGFKRLEKLAHTGENLLGMVREGKLEATPPIITGLLELMDILRAILQERSKADGKRRRAATTGTIIANLEQLQSAPPRPRGAAGKEAGNSAPLNHPIRTRTRSRQQARLQPKTERRAYCRRTAVCKRPASFHPSRPRRLRPRRRPSRPPLQRLQQGPR